MGGFQRVSLLALVEIGAYAKLQTHWTCREEIIAKFQRTLKEYSPVYFVGVTLYQWII